MLSKMILDAYGRFIELSLWVSLFLSVWAGWSIRNPMTGEGGGFIGAIVGFLIWAIVAIVFFGAFLVLADIRKTVRNIEAAE